jgi:hypothetical protein
VFQLLRMAFDVLSGPEWDKEEVKKECMLNSVFALRPEQRYTTRGGTTQYVVNYSSDQDKDAFQTDSKRHGRATGARVY